MENYIYLILILILIFKYLFEFTWIVNNLNCNSNKYAIFYLNNCVNMQAKRTFWILFRMKKMSPKVCNAFFVEANWIVKVLWELRE